MPGLRNHQGRDDVTTPNPFGGITVAQATANLSALTCPTGHRNAVPVEDLLGECVAALCPDCDRQLPAEWAMTKAARHDYEAEHSTDHHGHPSVRLLACRLCGEE